MSTSYLISASYTWGQFTPVFFLAGLAILLLLADAFLSRLSKQAFPLIAAIGCFLATCGMVTGPWKNPYGMLAAGSAALCLLLAFDYRTVVHASVAGGDREEGSGELSILMLLATAGVVALTRARDLIMLFVSLETITLSSYALAGYFRRNRGSVEAGVKYLVLGAVSTGILVMGIAWFFGTTGTFALTTRFEQAALSNPYLCIGFLLSLALLFVGIFFKAGAVPMHTWIPDVYQGSPTPVSAFLAVVSKLAGFAALVLLTLPLAEMHRSSAGMLKPVMFALSIVTIATLLVGNLGAIPQQNIKRLLGYSSIGQAGFILVFFTGLRSSLRVDTLFYLLAYGLATLPLFFVIGQLRMQRGNETISIFRGLGKTNPRIAFLTAVCLASLAGVPLTAGFLAKLTSFRSALMSTMPGAPITSALMVVMVICATAGFYYYFKVLRVMYWEEPPEDDLKVHFSALSTGVLTLCVLGILVLGVCPMLF